MKFALAHQNPLATGLVTGNSKASSASSFSLMSISNPEVLLWSLKPAEEGISQGLITRFWNITDKPVQAQIKLNKPVKSGWQTSHLETNENILKPVKGAVNTQFLPQQINTYRLGIYKIK